MFKNNTRFVRFTLLVALASLCANIQAAEPGDYVHSIRPLLNQRCVPCHGTLKQEADLRLDAGSLIPQDIHDELLRRVTSDDETDRMPPEGSRLTAGQLAELQQWIHAGAPFPQDELIPTKPSEHWSFQPIKRPTRAGDPP